MKLHVSHARDYLTGKEGEKGGQGTVYVGLLQNVPRTPPESKVQMYWFSSLPPSGKKKSSFIKIILALMFYFLHLFKNSSINFLQSYFASGKFPPQKHKISLHLKRTTYSYLVSSILSRIHMAQKSLFLPEGQAKTNANGKRKKNKTEGNRGKSINEARTIFSLLQDNGL